MSAPKRNRTMTADTRWLLALAEGVTGSGTGAMLRLVPHGGDRVLAGIANLRGEPLTRNGELLNAKGADAGEAIRALRDLIQRQEAEPASD